MTPSTVTCRFGHRLEQRRLRARHRAVDLVDEDDVREDRAGPELELARLLVEDRQTGDVGRLEVGRALDAREASAPSTDWRDRAGEDRLRGAGDVLEQDVAAGDERRDDERDLLGLADDDALDVREEAAGRFGGRVALLGRRLASRFDHGGRKV